MVTATIRMVVLLAAVELLNVGMTDGRGAKELLGKPGMTPENKISMIDHRL